jgi:hypothetical protein
MCSQAIRVRSDTGTAVIGGSFQLSFNFKGANRFDPEEHAFTPKIAFDASAGVFRTLSVAL